MFKNNPETYVRREVKTSIAPTDDKDADTARREAEFLRCLQNAPLGGFVQWGPAGDVGTQD
ncbi:hypothetical protein R69927_05650 [Paraburkholderia domus]|jgi:hypothetical protein|nr:hypothetical protein R70006_03726 [Paraburkholderia domus]CAE6905527.1 hypothetical protein R69927_05650 [Paraburkholderia domus]